MNLNTGKPWSEFDIRDLKWCLEHGESVERIAEFLCRDEDEITKKTAELKAQSHELGEGEDADGAGV